MTINIENLKALHGYFEGSSDAVDTASAQKAISYKADVCKRFINISADQIDKSLGGTSFYVTRKIDGEMSVLFFDKREAVIINRSGRVRIGLPCIEDAKKTLVAAGIKQAVIPSELYVDESNGRTRISDVLNALADKNKISNLRLAMFDILELDGQEYKAGSYNDIHRKLKELFGAAAMCGPVLCERVDSKTGVKDLFSRWVEEQGAEGLVVRSELPLVYKVKPRYSIDVAVVGYSEGTGEAKGQIRTLLLAMMTKDGCYQVFGKTGGGFTEEQKVELLKRLEPLIIESQYIEVDSNNTAFRMIKPEVIIEVMINDVIFETSKGMVSNAMLELKDSSYAYRANVNGLSVIYPIFVRFREDKKAVYEDIRLEQINEFSFIEPTPAGQLSVSLAKSFLLYRSVFKKEAGGKLMVQKFLVWETNKTEAGYPTFVFHYTNFSSDRKDPLQREVRVSNDFEQIRDMYFDSMRANLKKGWIQVEQEAS